MADQGDGWNRNEHGVQVEKNTPYSFSFYIDEHGVAAVAADSELIGTDFTPESARTVARFLNDWADTQ